MFFFFFFDVGGTLYHTGEKHLLTPLAVKEIVKPSKTQEAISTMNVCLVAYYMNIMLLFDSKKIYWVLAPEVFFGKYDDMIIYLILVIIFVLYPNHWNFCKIKQIIRLV